MHVHATRSVLRYESPVASTMTCMTDIFEQDIR